MYRFIYREIFASKNIPHVLNKVLDTIIKSINAIKFNLKCEILKKNKNKTEDHITLLFCTEVRC